MVLSLWETVWQFLMKRNTLLLYEPAIEFLCIYPKYLRADVHAKICTQIALFIIAKIGTKPRCPSVGEWTDKLWHLQTMDILFNT